jgi:thioester reductase-like protein
VIYRPGRITGHSQSGAWQPDDVLSLMIRGCIQLGMSPIFANDDTMELLPVDYVSRAIVALSQRKTSLGQAFHLYNSTMATANEVITWINSFGYTLQAVEYSTWLEALMRATAEGKKNVISPFLELLPAPESPRASSVQPPIVIPDTRNTQAALARAGIVCPPADAQLLHAYLAYMVRTNMLEAPSVNMVSL